MSEGESTESPDSPQDVKVLSMREDWPLIPYLLIILIGFGLMLD